VNGQVKDTTILGTFLAILKRFLKVLA